MTNKEVKSRLKQLREFVLNIATDLKARNDEINSTN